MSLPTTSPLTNKVLLNVSSLTSQKLKMSIDKLFTDGDDSGSPPSRPPDLDGKNWNGVRTWHGQIAISRYVAQSSLELAYMYVFNILQVLYHGAIHFAEVKFYFTKTFGDESQAFALVSLYLPPNKHLLQITHNTLVICKYQGEEMLVVIDVKSILAVVAMVPFPFLIDGHGDQYFMIEQIGLDVVDGDDPEDNE